MTSRRWRADLPYLLHRGGSWAIQHTPQSVVNGGAWALAQMSYLMASRKRRLLTRHLWRVLGRNQPEPPTNRQLAATARQGFVAYARYYTATSRLQSLTASEIDAGFSYDGWEHIVAARQNETNGAAPGGEASTKPTAKPSAKPSAKPKGVILALPHLGNWEWAGYWLTQVPRIPVSAVVEAPASAKLFEWMTSFRQKLNMHIIALDSQAGANASKALADGHVLCLLCDRDIAGGGVEVNFFGEDTTLPAGPATLALRSGAALLPTAVYFDNGRQHAVVLPPVDTSRKQGVRFRDEVQRVTQELAHRLEDLIMRAPQQWHLMSPNWPSDLELEKRAG